MHSSLLLLIPGIKIKHTRREKENGYIGVIHGRCVGRVVVMKNSCACGSLCNEVRRDIRFVRRALKGMVCGSEQASILFASLCYFGSAA